MPNYMLLLHESGGIPSDISPCRASLSVPGVATGGVFNEGYAATSGDALVREDISGEAIRLAALVTRHPVTATPPAYALLALLLLQAARFPARVRSDGELFRLRDQDRGKWDLTRYHLAAEIAAPHASAPSWEDSTGAAASSSTIGSSRSPARQS